MKIIIFTLTFAATVPVGIMIGILLTMNRTDEEGPTDAELYITGSLNSIAAGILIYVAMVEMIAEDFQEAKIATNIGLKVQMFAALMIGTLFMAVLAIWA
jgi:solute carrier family 39 (zinc transporter), member 1/2/3